jgi:hypothetical protein
MPWQMHYKGAVTLKKRSEECSYQNISLIPLQMKMIQQVEVISQTKRSTCLRPAVRVAALYDLSVTLNHAVS